jgi:hypothetical protein
MVATTSDDANDVPQRPRGSVRLCCVAGVALVLLLGTYAAVHLFCSRPMRISKETTCITAPLTPDGDQVDYFAAIEQAVRPDSIASDDNGYRLIVQHLGKAGDSEPAHFEDMLRRLSLDPGAVRQDMVFQEPLDFLTDYAASEEFDEAFVEQFNREWEHEFRGAAGVLSERLLRLWTADDLPMMTPWLADSGPALDLIGRAVLKPTFHIPLVRRNEYDLIMHDIAFPETQRMRSFARALHGRANYRIGTGDIDGAIDDIIACKRLGRHLRQAGLVIDLQVGVSIELFADEIGIAGSLEHPPTKVQLQRLFHEADAHLPEAGLHQALRSERFVMLDAMQGISRGEAALSELDALGRSPRYLSAFGLDWNVVAKRFNEHYDAFTGGERRWTQMCGCKSCNPFAVLGEAILGEWPHPCIHDPLGPLDFVSFLSLRRRSEHLADVTARQLFPALEAARESVRRSTCMSQIKRIVLAMLMYERDHGTLPPAWSADSHGAPLQSWRVLLLPYLGYQTLYDAIRLDEPWDSQHNRQFHGEDLAIYRCPSDPAAQPGQTTYSVVVGPAMPFEPGEGKRLADFGPQSDDMILLVERAHPVGWMAPAREIQQAVAERGIQRNVGHSTPAPSDSIASHHEGGAQFGLRNGAAVFLSDLMYDGDFKKMLRGTFENRNRPY